MEIQVKNPRGKPSLLTDIDRQKRLEMQLLAADVSALVDSAFYRDLAKSNLVAEKSMKQYRKGARFHAVITPAIIEHARPAVADLARRIALAAFAFFAVCTSFFAQIQSSQTLLSELLAAPRLCDDRRADSIFDKNSLAAISQTSPDFWHLRYYEVVDLFPDGYEVAGRGEICAYQFTEIEGKIYQVGRPPIIVPLDENRSGKVTKAWASGKFEYQTPEKCELFWPMQLAITNKLPLLFFFRFKSENCVVIARIVADGSEWPARIEYRRLDCPP